MFNHPRSRRNLRKGEKIISHDNNSIYFEPTDTEAVSGTDKQLFNEQELKKFATFYLDKWDENTSEDVVAESFVDYWWNTDRTCRRCSECGKLMREGYCVDMGVAYYCSKDCLHTDFTDEEWNEECENNDQSYYTEW